MQVLLNLGERMVTVVIGNSGSGKSTLAKGLCQLGIGFGYLGTGDRLRKELVKNPSFAKIVAAYTSTGDHVPNEVMLPWVRKWFSEVENHRLVIADGFPRNVDQVDEALLMFHEHKYLKVVCVYVDTPPEKCAQHLILQAHEAEKNGDCRDDSDEKAITNRLKTFDHKVKPILKLLRERTERFVHIDTTSVNIKDPMMIRDIAIEAEIIYPA